MNLNSSTPSIFVQIPAYHDYEIINTMDSLNVFSSGESIVNVGVHFNYYNELHEDIENMLNRKFSHTKISKEINKAPTALGPSISRQIANSFYDGEDFYLQIDSHMKFRNNWDLELIEDFKKLSNIYRTKIAISEYPYSYTYNEKKEGGWWHPPRNSNIVNESDIKWIERLIDKQIRPLEDKCESRNILDNRHNHVSGAFLFSTGSMHEIYTKEPNVLLEETILSMKLVSKGYNVVGPSVQTVKHMNSHPFMHSEEGASNQMCDEYKQMLKQYPRRIARIDFGHMDLNNNDNESVKNEILGISTKNNFLFNGMSFSEYLQICSLEAI